MTEWKGGPPTEEGLYVLEWMNAGGFGVFLVVDYDGILIAHHNETAHDSKCTQLSKWSIARHLRIPHPMDQWLEERLGQRFAETSQQ